ncbi:nitrogenase component 1 [Clostridium sp. SHJSY1]|uniref:nitrogenase component 1 n=1 Tax=Clostridium sp. SHJSY1 TaxID=2942483 RepID=UPI00287518B0|nr:nitrogenase component 1 [Clostridium sp. SHJSY1]MDS0527403.1 nitrogenase component 1 [Clostridium sp. SHJSY1]
MGLHRFRPMPSGRMGALWTLSTIKNATLIEFGSMGHMLYGKTFLERIGVHDGCKLYSTHIDESDIALGGTERLKQAIDEIIINDNPEVIFILPSTVPEMIGTDLKALCEDMQNDYIETPIIPVGFGGFDVEKHKGVEQTLKLLVKELPEECSLTANKTFNIIGSCADIYRFKSDADEIVRILKGAFGIDPVCIMTSDTSVGEIKKMASAHINLVIRREGIEAAKYLEKRFGTEFIHERPYGFSGTKAWLEKISEILNLKIDEDFMEKEFKGFDHTLKFSKQVFLNQSEKARLSIGGHADVVKGILNYAYNELGVNSEKSWCDSMTMTTEKIPYWGEDKWSKEITKELKGLLMASDEILTWANHSLSMQIDNKGSRWELNPYEPPFVGFRGAMNLASLWVNYVLENNN